jgi:aminopeptidase
MNNGISSIYDRQVLDKYADVLAWALETSLGRGLEKGDPVLVRFDSPALPVAEVLYSRLVDRGVHVSWRMEPTPGMQRDFYRKSNMKQIMYVTPGDYELYSSLAGMIRIIAPEKLWHLADVDRELIGRAGLARKPLRLLRDKREGMGLYAWTLGGYPTRALAEAVGAGEAEYAESMARACMLNKADPVREWRDVLRRLSELKDWLNAMPAKAFHVESESIDLVVPFGGKRRWQGLTGQNMPSYELYFSPDWRGVRGSFHSDLPSLRNGGVVRGARLKFEDGRVVEAEAETGMGVLVETLSSDPGASKVGEFSLTDASISNVDSFMGMTMFDENYGGSHGNCHIALGASYPSSYDGNPMELDEPAGRELGFNASSIHWDLVNTEKKKVTVLLAGGEKKTIYEDGRFKY